MPLLEGRVDDKTEKFKVQGEAILRDVPIREVEEKIRDGGNRKVSVLHDGAAALFGEFAMDPGANKGGVGILTFGRSIGFGWALEGNPVISPYTSWVSHIQLRPTFPFPAGPSVTCPGCKQRGCWRLLYQSLKGDQDDPRIECLRALVEVTAQGISSVLNVLPTNRLFLGGGWTQYNLNEASGCFDDRLKTKRLHPYEDLLRRLKHRICIDPDKVLRFAQRGDESGAIGAAYYCLEARMKKLGIRRPK